jgi:TolB-like protein
MDLENRELRNDGRLVRLQPQPFTVLVLLLSRAGELVSRADIQHKLWSNDTFVDFDQGINFCIKQIRAALDDDAAEPRYLKTLPRRGYRFIAPVFRDGEERPVATPYDRSTPRPVPSLSPSRVAVLPFASIGPEGKLDYVAEGLTEEIILTLSQVRGLRIISRTSVMRYKDTTKSALEIGHELSVGTILEGSVRTDGKKLRVNAVLIDTGTQEMIWSQDYDRELNDLFALQADISEHIARALELWTQNSELRTRE